MQTTELLLKTITFPNKGVKLEDILRLILFDKTSFDFDESLHSIIRDLRKYSNFIKSIGYTNNENAIYVKFLFNLSITPLEEINSIGQ